MTDLQDQALSTLSEINRQLELRMYELLHYIAPYIWTDSNQVIYSPSDDLDFATQIYLLKNKSAGNIILPFAYYTRDTGQISDRTYDHALRPFDGWLSTHAKENPTFNFEVKVIPAILHYVLRVYDSLLENTEHLWDGLIIRGIREKSRQYQYDSPILNISSPYRIEIGNPKYDRVPTLHDRLAGKGRLYSIQIPIECRCILGRSRLAHRIYSINLDYREPINPPTIKVDGIVIDSNTVVLSKQQKVR